MLLGCWAIAFPAKPIAGTGAILSERSNATSVLVDEGGSAGSLILGADASLSRWRLLKYANDMLRPVHLFFNLRLRDTFNQLCRF